MALTEVIEATFECSNGHATKQYLISPVLLSNGTANGSVTSSAHFCDECDSPDMHSLGDRLVQVELDDEEARIHRVTREAPRPRWRVGEVTYLGPIGHVRLVGPDDQGYGWIAAQKIDAVLDALNGDV
jgi:hypothetical protein